MRRLGSLVCIPINLAIIGVCQVLWLGVYALYHLIWRDSQRAEYLADYLAATVSGTEAMTSWLEKLQLHRVWDMTIQRVSLNDKDALLFEEFVQRVNQAASAEPEPNRAGLLDETLRLDVTHPPTPYRIQFLQSRANLQPKIELSHEESAAIDKELAPLQASVRRQVIDAHRRSLEMAYY